MKSISVVQNHKFSFTAQDSIITFNDTKHHTTCKTRKTTALSPFRNLMTVRYKLAANSLSHHHPSISEKGGLVSSAKDDGPKHPDPVPEAST